jgi:hypothetical protein
MSETCAIDPDSGESLLFCIFAPAGFTLGATYTVSGYATTPTTTLTEQHDFGFRDGASDGMTIAVATAPYTGTTQITSYSATASEDPDNVKQVIFAINAPQSATADVGHLSVSPTLFGVTSSNTATATVSHLSITPTLNGVEAVDSSDTTQWSNQSKNTSTWTNTDKSN